MMSAGGTEASRILFAAHAPTYYRFFEGTLLALAAKGHRITITTEGATSTKGVELSDFADPDGGVEVGGKLPRRKDIWGPFVRGLRGTMDFVRYLAPEFADARALRQRIKRKVLPRSLYWLDWIRRLPRWQVKALLGFLAGLERAVPADPRLLHFMRTGEYDLVVLSSLVEPGSWLVDAVKCAQEIGLPTAVCIASWDNLTNKGHLRVEPDIVIVWNERQKQEAVEFHGIAPDRVTVTGAQVFDSWFESHPTTTREEFCGRLGLPANRPLIVFLGSSAFISEAGDDVAWVKNWLLALRAASDLRVGTCSVIVRPHPYHWAHWQDEELEGFEHAVVWPRSYPTVFGDADRADYFETLWHCDAVVGLNTSAMIEAAILGKPVHTVLLEEYESTQEGTLHFHHLLRENGGFLEVAQSLEEHTDQLARSLSLPEAHSRSEEAVRDFVRPLGLAKPVTPIVASALEEIMRTWKSPRGRSWANVLVGMILWPIALLIARQRLG